MKRRNFLKALGAAISGSIASSFVYVKRDEVVYSFTEQTARNSDAYKKWLESLPPLDSFDDVAFPLLRDTWPIDPICNLMDDAKSSVKARDNNDVA